MILHKKGTNLGTEAISTSEIKITVNGADDKLSTNAAGSGIYQYAYFVGNTTSVTATTRRNKSGK